MIEYTHIVIGAGSSGCVVASRLSEEPDYRVLLIEAGPDYLDGKNLPEPLINGFFPDLTSHDWGMAVNGTRDNPIAAPRGKVVGGSSAINSCIALRPEPTDFEEWSSLAGTTWSWESVLPYFLKIENDFDFSNQFHSNSGPLPIRRWTEAELLPLSSAFIAACINEGFTFTEDLNYPNSSGVGVLPMNLINGQRQSATKIFLDTARVRDNLTIWSETTVDRIIFEGVRAIGVAVLRESRELIVSGNMIILCAGTYCTPTILMRSGIGCSKELEQQGITTVVDLPGVGANLIDHAQCYIAVNATAGTVSYPVPCAQVLLKYSASCMGYTNDMQLSILNWVDLREFSPELVERTSNHSTFMFMVQLEHPLARGKVSLRSSDPNDLPLVELNYCGDVKDIAKLREGIRLSWRILHSPMIKPYVNKIVNIEDHVLAENDLLDRFIRENVLTAHHPMGTSRMGCSSDSLTVVDQYGRVHKTEHLWIADASIIPIALRANTNLTCLAVGEKISDFLKSGLNLE